MSLPAVPDVVDHDCGAADGRVGGLTGPGLLAEFLEKNTGDAYFRTVLGRFENAGIDDKVARILQDSENKVNVGFSAILGDLDAKAATVIATTTMESTSEQEQPQSPSIDVISLALALYLLGVMLEVLPPDNPTTTIDLTIAVLDDQSSTQTAVRHYFQLLFGEARFGTWTSLGDPLVRNVAAHLGRLAVARKGLVLASAEELSESVRALVQEVLGLQGADTRTSCGKAGGVEQV